jgi:hypothetical protein
MGEERSGNPMVPENGFFQDWDSGYDTDGFVESKELAPSNQEGVHL